MAIPVLTERISAYFKEFIPGAAVPDGQMLIDRAKEGGEALRVAVVEDVAKGRTEVLNDRRLTEQVEHVVCFLDDLWEAIVPLVDWDEVAAAIKGLAIQETNDSGENEA